MDFASCGSAQNDNFFSAPPRLREEEPPSPSIPLPLPLSRGKRERGSISLLSPAYRGREVGREGLGGMGWGWGYVNFASCGFAQDNALRSAPPRLRLNNHSGFTLLEILIVLVILALVAGLITLTVGGDERNTIQREAQRLTGALEYAADRARFRREIVGVSALPDGRGWRFWSIPEDAGKNTSWRPVTDDAPLAAHRLSGDLSLRPLHYAGQPLAADAIVPLLPSGRSEPYALELRGADWSLRLNGDPLGRLSATLPEMSGAASGVMR